MSKVAEKQYLEQIGEDGRRHSLGKPFSDADCGRNLAPIGTTMMLLPPAPGRILDMGCGSGWTSAFYAKCGYVVVGQDIAEDMIDLARENQALQQIGGNLSFIVTDFESVAGDGQFDAVIFFDCLHHADDERAAIASAYRALKPGGILITHEPGEGHATTPASISAMAMYGVNEKDMPPHLIIRYGLELGFESPKIFPMQADLLLLFESARRPRSF